MGVLRFEHSDDAFSAPKRLGSRYDGISELNDAAHTPAVYASRRRSPRRHARLASGCSASLGRAGVQPAGSRSEVSVISHPMTSSSARLSWRTGGDRRAREPASEARRGGATRAPGHLYLMGTLMSPFTMLARYSATF